MTQGKGYIQASSSQTPKQLRKRGHEDLNTNNDGENGSTNLKSMVVIYYSIFKKQKKSIKMSNLMYKEKIRAAESETSDLDTNNDDTSNKATEWIDCGQCVKFKDVSIGDGETIDKKNTIIKINYTIAEEFGEEIGKVFSQEFKVGNRNVPTGWSNGVMGMKVGGTRLIKCPPAAAFGKSGLPPFIAGGVNVLFNISIEQII